MDVAFWEGSALNGEESGWGRKEEVRDESGG